MSTRLEAALAANRFGLGARPGELDAIQRDARGWLGAQIADPAAFRISVPGLPDRRQALDAFIEYNQMRREQRQGAAAPGAPAAPPPPAYRRRQPQPGAPQPGAPMSAAPGETMTMDEGAGQDRAVVEAVQTLGRTLRQDTIARTTHALSTPHGFAERLAYFWSNHFTMAATKAQALPFPGVFEREVVRAGMTGKFSDMLLASTRHIGMQIYLDQAQSAGPNSAAGRMRDMGLNENLAREILELHTLGAQGGYTQADVTEFAKALTGWSVVSPRTQRFTRGGQLGDFQFVALMHEPGPRTILGKTYPDTGEGQAQAVLLDIARHPATARRIATKLARHFIADEPPAGAVARLERAFRDSDGDLPTVHRALIALPEAWGPAPVKFKTPNEFLVSALRLAGLPQVEPRALNAAFQLLGQPPYRAPSPEGWPDDAASWAGPDALMKRLEWSQAYAERIGQRVRPEAVAEAALGPLLTPRTRQAIERAESGQQGLVLALMSPEFQRR